MNFQGLPISTALGLFAASALLLTGLYFLRSRYRRQTVVTTMFWQEALKNPQRRTLLGRWSHWLSWLLTLLGVLLLLLALTEPVIPSSKTDKTVLIQDASQPESIRAAALRLITPAITADQTHFAVISAADQPILVKDFAERFYPQHLHPTTAPTAPARLDRAIYLAHTLLRDQGIAGRVIVLTPYRALTAAAANGTPVTVVSPLTNPAADALPDLKPGPAAVVQPLKVMLAAAVPVPLQLLLESSRHIRLTANAKEADLVIGTTAAGPHLLLADTPPRQVSRAVWQSDKQPVAGFLTPRSGFVLRSSLGPEAATAADPAFAVALTRLLFELAGREIPGRISTPEPGPTVALSPLLPVLPPTAFSPELTRSIPPFAWTGWLFAAALLVLAADAYLYAKNRNP